MPSVKVFSCHVDTEGGLSGFYKTDTVHLSEVALDIFNLDLQSCIELAAVYCQAHF